MAAFAADAQGSLLLVPRRLVFEDGRRVQELNVANNGKDTARYSIDLVAMNMREDGTIEPVRAEDSANKVLSLLKVYPRHILLAPGESQVVKVQLQHRGAGKLEPGEYRSHLRFKPIPKARQGRARMKKMVTKVRLKLKPVFSFSVPVIIRVGASDTRLTLDDLRFTNKGDTLPRLQLTARRSGNMSVYGDMFVQLTTADGKTTPVATLKGFSVFAPNLTRSFLIDLKPKNLNFKGGRLTVSCFTQVEERSVRIAETSLELP